MSLAVLLYILALLCFGLWTFRVDPRPINIAGAGFFFLTLALMVSGGIINV